MKIKLWLLALGLILGIWALENGIDYFLIQAGTLPEYLTFKGIYRELFILGDVTLAILVATLLFYRVFTRQQKTLDELNLAHDKLKFREDQLRKVNQQLHALNQQLQNSFNQLEANNRQLQASERQLRETNADLTTSHAALLDSQARFQKMAANIPGVVYQFLRQPDDAMSFPFVSEKCQDMIGVSAEAVQQDSAIVFGFIHPNDRASFYQSITDSARMLNPWHWEGRFLVCGTLKWLKGIAQPELQADGSVLWDGLIIDVTDFKRAEQALQQSKQMLQLVLDTIPSSVFWKDRDSVYLGCNRVFLADAGMAATDTIVRKTDFDLAWREQAPQFRADDHQVMETNTPKLGFEEPLTKADRSLHWLRTSKVPMRDAEGKVIGILGTYEDITERKLAEEVIKESEQRFKAIFDNAADGILLVDTETKKFRLGNNAICEMLGYTPEKIATMQVADIHPETALPYVMEQFEKQARREMKIASSLPVKRKDGSVIYVDVSVFFITLAGKTCMAGIFRDITERKQAEDQIRASLREKEVLLKEIHHRVKNNLQIVSSLLSLQSRYIADPQDLQLFRESQTRVRTMALVHEKLYQSRDLAQICFAEYLRLLTDELLRFYKVHEVQLSVEVENHIQLGIDMAIPCALIIHELISNALKYAFAVPLGDGTGAGAGWRKGPNEIRVIFREDPGAGFVLVVSDNGVGLPPHVEQGHAKSLGWHLIMALAEQMHGRVEINRHKGTAVNIRLPKAKETKQRMPTVLRETAQP